MFADNTSPAVSPNVGGLGGAIYDDASTPGTPTALTVRNTTFTSNTANLQGGAIADVGTGVLTLTGDTFGGGGAAGNNGGDQGGAVYDSAQLGRDDRRQHLRRQPRADAGRRPSARSSAVAPCG